MVLDTYTSSILLLLHTSIHKIIDFSYKLQTNSLHFDVWSIHGLPAHSLLHLFYVVTQVLIVYCRANTFAGITMSSIHLNYCTVLIFCISLFPHQIVLATRRTKRNPSTLMYPTLCSTVICARSTCGMPLRLRITSRDVRIWWCATVSRRATV